MTPNTPKKLLVSPRQNALAVAIGGDSRQLPAFDHVRELQKLEAIPDNQVFIDAGFMTIKVKAACELWGWTRVFSWIPERAEIDAATKDVPFA